MPTTNTASTQQQQQQQQQMRIILLGPPGSGKGTQAAVIKEKYNICYLTTEGEEGFPRQALSHRTPNTVRVEEAYRKLGYIPFELTIGMLKDTLERRPDCAKGFILEGFPRSVEQARALMQYSEGGLARSSSREEVASGKSERSEIGGTTSISGANVNAHASGTEGSGADSYGSLSLQSGSSGSASSSIAGLFSSPSPSASSGTSVSTNPSSSSSSSSYFFHKTFGNAHNEAIRIDKVVSFHVTDEHLIERVAGGLIHPPSKRVYHEVIAPPLVSGKDDVTGEPLMRRATDEEIHAKREELLNYRRSFNPVRDFFRNETNIFYEIETTNRTCGEVRRDVMAALECQNSVPALPLPWYKRWFGLR